MPNNAAVILNCSSGSRRAAEHRERLAGLFRSAGIDADLLCAEHGANVADLAESAARKPYRMIVAAGGDGTINAVATAAVRTGKPMAALPLGTVNHFAKRMGMPLRLEDAVQSLVEAEPTPVDVGEVNGHIFVNNTTVGVYPRIIRYRELLRKTRDINKWVAFAWAAARMLRGHDTLRLRMVTDGQERRVETPFVFVGTGDFKLGDLDLGGGAALLPGTLGLCLAPPKRSLSLPEIALKALARRPREAAELEVLRMTEVVLHTPGRARLHIGIDGEVLVLPSPLRYRVRPGALCVLRPRAQEALASAPREAAPPAEKAGLRLESTAEG